MRNFSMFNFTNCCFVVPVRKNSKGVPLKNRKLIQHTLNIVPPDLQNKLYITTDDSFILDNYSNKFNVIKRKASYATDTCSIKSTLLDLSKDGTSLPLELTTIVLLYVVYPGRTWEDVTQALSTYVHAGADSLLCRVPYKGVHPYLLMENRDTMLGKSLVRHNLYRRQDYPSVFELSHYVCIFNRSKLHYLNDNMYNDSTIYYPIKKPVNVDTLEDMDQWMSLQ